MMVVEQEAYIEDGHIKINTNQGSIWVAMQDYKDLMAAGESARGDNAAAQEGRRMAHYLRIDPEVGGAVAMWGWTLAVMRRQENSNELAEASQRMRDYYCPRTRRALHGD